MCVCVGCLACCFFCFYRACVFVSKGVFYCCCCLSIRSGAALPMERSNRRKQKGEER